MYILINEDNNPFAVITKFDKALISKAIEEEFSVEDVVIDELPNVDWGEVKEFNVAAKDADEKEDVAYTLEISRIVAY